MAFRWSKPSHASAARVFRKPASNFRNPPCSKGGCGLDAFPNRPTTSTISRLAPKSRPQVVIAQVDLIIGHVDLVIGSTQVDLVKGSAQVVEVDLVKGSAQVVEVSSAQVDPVIGSARVVEVSSAQVSLVSAQVV
ncbi:hypothetical protein TNCV_3846611 [Trichonephila clavipes]|nr:hypothetical protein TNCV_3846611 [Trichonephila clavipes]